ncbi:26S proteasome non-ATPase regulatory subunit 5 [Cydia strobilella]|uniref:26S proteasome non-ATPase regulatory subunit 5 n=1 Tax=Cydia strobilella TaxID=1100964 RepID=UPI003007977C
MVISDADQYRQFLNSLHRDESRPAALNDIKNLLSLKPANEISAVIRDVGIKEIIQCLNVPDKTQFHLTCEVLKLCCEKFELGGIIRNYTGHFMFMLRHEKTCVRQIAVDEVAKVVTSDPSLLPVPQYIDVFVAVAQQVLDKDVSITNKAILVTSNLTYEAYPKVLEEMKIALEYDSSSKCNAFEVVVNVASKSPELLKLCADHQYFDVMVSELDTDDVLYQLNILELMSRLAVAPHGINHFVKTGVLKRVSELVAALPNNPLSALLTPGYMKFFGTIAHKYPQEIFKKYPVLMNLMFDTFASQDQGTLPIALDTLGFIGSTIEGKLSLAALGSQYTQGINAVAQLTRNGSTETKVRALHCFASLIGVDFGSPLPRPIDHRVTLMTREWFRTLSQSPMVTLLELCKNPFPDIRSAAFSLLDAVCQHQWGEELIARTAGFIEYLLDRSVTYPKELKEVKYDIIRRLSNSLAFDESILLRLQVYVQQGPFYPETEMQVATEEGD